MSKGGVVVRTNTGQDASEIWPEMNSLDHSLLAGHRTARLEIPLNSAANAVEAAKMLRRLADNLERVYALKGPMRSERSVLFEMLDYIFGTQRGLNALCPWRKEHKRRMENLRRSME